MTQKPSPRILIVDDDDDMVRMMSIFLGSRGCTCITAKTGAQGAFAFSPDEFDLVVTDLHMPAGDGVALIERIRRTRNIPIIIVTGYSQQYASQVQNLPGVSVLHKPFDANQLWNLVAQELAIQDAA